VTKGSLEEDLIILPAKYIDELKSAPEETVSLVGYIDDVRDITHFPLCLLNAQVSRSSPLHTHAFTPCI
jgi:hypothetical protein